MYINNSQRTNLPQFQNIPNKKTNILLRRDNLATEDIHKLQPFMAEFELAASQLQRNLKSRPATTEWARSQPDGHGIHCDRAAARTDSVTVAAAFQSQLSDKSLKDLYFKPALVQIAESSPSPTSGTGRDSVVTQRRAAY